MVLSLYVCMMVCVGAVVGRTMFMKGELVGMTTSGGTYIGDTTDGGDLDCYLYDRVGFAEAGSPVVPLHLLFLKNNGKGIRGVTAQGGKMVESATTDGFNNRCKVAIYQRGTKLVVVGYGNSKVAVRKIYYSGGLPYFQKHGTISIHPNFTPLVTGDVLASMVSQMESIYVFVAIQRGTGTLIGKWDPTIPDNVAMARTNLLASRPAPDIMKFIGGDNILIVDRNTAIFSVVYYGDLTATQTYNLPGKIGYVLVDNLVFNKTYTEELASPQLACYDYLTPVGSDPTACGTGTAFALPTLANLGLLNLGSLAFLAGISSVSSVNKAYIVDKTSFTLASTFTFGLSMYYSGSGFMVGDVDTTIYDSPTFGILETSTKNLHTYRFIYDDCVIRDTSTYICSECPATYYLDSLNPWNYCILPLSFLPNYGPDNGTPRMQRPCPVGCTYCPIDYTICVTCDVGKFFYLNSTSSKCVSPYEISQGFGVNASNQISACSSPGCLVCQFDTTVCTKCNLAGSYYLDPLSNTCMMVAAIPAAKGIDPVTKLISSCATGCLSCTLNTFTCTQCDVASGYFLTGDNVCISNSQLPNGYRVDPTKGTLQACKAGCTKCPTGSTICTGCFLANNYFYNSTANTCVLVDQLPDGTGANLVTGNIELCQVANCKVCKADFTLCETCINKYILDMSTFTTCSFDSVTVYGQLVATKNPQKTSKVSVSFILGFDPNIGSDSQEAALVEKLEPLLIFEIAVKAPSGVTEQIKNYDLIMNKASNTLIIDYTIKDPLQEAGLYSISFSTSEKIPTTIGGKPVIILPTEYDGDYNNEVSEADMNESKAKGDMVGALAPQSEKGLEATLTLFAFISLDPTGLLMRVSQILTVVSKLSFIDINYGQKLGAFMKQVGQLFEGFGSKSDNRYIYNSAHTRGKLSLYRIKLSLIEKYLARLVGFLASWAVRIGMVCVMLLRQKKGLPRWLMICFFFLYKIHSMQFNLVFFDLIFYSSRTLMHSKGLILDQVLALISLFFLSLDLVNIGMKTLDDNSWAKLYRMRLKENPHLRAINHPKKKESDSLDNTFSQSDSSKMNIKDEETEEKKVPPLEMLTSEESETEQERKKRESKPIDYHLTFNEIMFDYHTFEFLSEFLRIHPDVYGSFFCRSYYMIHIFRISFYHSIVIVAQYMNGFAIFSLLALEIFKVGYSLYYYISKRYLKFFLLLLLETSQSLFLCAFLGIAIMIKDKDSDAEINLVYQNVGTWCVIASCFMEYILLLAYIILYLVSLVKNNSAAQGFKKRQHWIKGIMNPKKISESFIVYKKDEIPIFERPLNTIKFSEIRDLAKNNRIKPKNLVEDNGNLQKGSNIVGVPPLKPSFIAKTIAMRQKTRNNYGFNSNITNDKLGPKNNPFQNETSSKNDNEALKSNGKVFMNNRATDNSLLDPNKHPGSKMMPKEELRSDSPSQIDRNDRNSSQIPSTQQTKKPKTRKLNLMDHAMLKMYTTGKNPQ